MKRNLLRFTFLLFTFFIFLQKSSATHIVGGEMNYKYLGGNDYEIRLTVYRDCYNGVPPFDDPAAVGIFDSSNTLVTTIYLNFTQSDTLIPDIDSTCLTPPTDVCYEHTTYIGVVNLPPIPGGYQLVYQRCCRNNTILNIVDPGNTGATYIAVIPDTALAPINSNPVFNNWTPPFICGNMPFVFDHSAIDDDGDSLVYKICNPYDGASATTPMPQPPFNPPYNPVVWQSPFSLSNVLGGIPLAIDSLTGLLTATPNTFGQFVYGICVQEYRNGVFISETKRDFQINVVDCAPKVVSAFFAPQINCSDSSVAFSNFSFGATDYFWDFGVISLTDDTSRLTNPVYFYPDTGTYTVTLIANDGNCSDTSQYTIYVGPNVFGGAGNDTTICIGDTIFLNGFGNGTFSWSPNYRLSNPSIANPFVFPDVDTSYVLTVSISSCIVKDTVNILVNNLLFKGGLDQTICKDSAVQIGLPPEPGITYLWTPATGLLSPDTLANPIAKPDSSTFYYLTVSDSLCTARDTVLVFVSQLAKPTLADMRMCTYDTLQIPVVPDPSLTYRWSPADGLNDTTVASPFASPDSSSQYILTISDGFCSEKDTMMILVTNLLGKAGKDDYLCKITSVQIGGPPEPGLNYTWTIEGTVFSTISNPVVSPSATTIYMLTVSDSFCASKDTVIINVFTNSKNLLPPDSICLPETTFVGIAPNSSLSYYWSPGNTLSDSTISNPTAFPKTTTEYILLVKGGICTDTFVQKITVGPEILFNMMDDSLVCLYKTIRIGIPDNGLKYSWSPGNTLNDSLSSNPLASPDTTTTYVLTVTADFCRKKDSVTITVSDTPVFADFTLSAFFDCEKVKVAFQNQSQGAKKYSWYFGGEFAGNSTNPVLDIPYESVNHIQLVAYNSDECSDTMELDQEGFKDLVREKIANVFTPNNDDKNDCFKIVYDEQLQLSEDCYEIKIFNRWGELMFKTNDSQICWEGTSRKNNKPAPDGVYYYLITIKELTITGYVHLIR